MASKTKRRRGNGKLEQKQRANEDRQRADRSDALIRQAEVTAKVEQATKQHDLDQSSERRKKQSGAKRRGRKKAVGPQQAEKLSPRAAWWLFKRRNQFGGERRWSRFSFWRSLGRRCGSRRSSSAHAHQHRAAQQQSLFAVGCRRDGQDWPVFGRDNLI